MCLEDEGDMVTWGRSRFLVYTQEEPRRRNKTSSFLFIDVQVKSVQVKSATCRRDPFNKVYINRRGPV